MSARPEYMRCVVFRPYRNDAGPWFRLYLLDYRTRGSRDYVSYRFEQIENGKRTTIAEGDDFGNSPRHSVDGDEAVEGLMGFLCLREHDTDSESFERLVATPEHLEFSRAHAEAVSSEVAARFSCYECGGTGELVRRKRSGYLVKVHTRCDR